MRKLCLIPITCMTILSLAACSKGAGSQNGSGAELSTEMQHKYLESCDCPTDANGVKQHAGSCDVPEISDKVELVADMYTSNMITKDGYATYR